MDPFSIAAGTVSFVDAAARLAHSCFQLYQFWESLQEAPAAVQVIKNDLMLLTKVLQDISNEVDLAPSVVFTLDACQTQVNALAIIVAEFDPEAAMAGPKRERLWSKFKMNSKLKQLEKFRKNLSEVRNTLMLGLMYQNIQKPRLCFTNQDVQIVQVVAPQATDAKAQLSNPILTKVSPDFETPDAPDVAPPPYSAPQRHSPTSGILVPQNEDTSLAGIASSSMVQKFLQRSLHLAVDDLFASGTVQELMDSTLNQATSFDSTYRGSYNPENYDINKVSMAEEGPTEIQEGFAEDRARRGPRLTRSKVCHQKSSMGVVLGSIWVRTSTLKATEGSSAASGQLEVITSFIFYPASWLTRFGLRYGTEANLQWSPTTGWRFNVAAVRAVPENSLIFDMCREGNVKAVQLMLARGDASLKDTTPKGWTPLHFAAAGGHIDLCAALIEAGAEKQALVYEGPTENSLSPIAIWSEYCQQMPALEKIRMLRLFGEECFDISELNGDGWVVGHNLIAWMAQEKTHMSQTSVHWLYNQKQTELLVALGAKSVWHGIQQAIRAFLIEEHENKLISKLLQADQGKEGPKYQSHVRAIGHWLALRASQRDLVPLAVQACQFLQVAGFDPVPGADGMGKRDINRTLPIIYTTWARMSPKILSNVKNLVEAELDFILEDLSMDRNKLASCIQAARDEPVAPSVDSSQRCCECGDDYTKVGTGLVRPLKISFDECRATKHKYHCQCPEYLYANGLTQALPVAEFGDTDEDVEEEIYKEVEISIDDLCEEYDKLGIHETVQGDPFCEAATLLYRSQGRRWIGLYKPSEILCASCFLQREEYVGENGPAGDDRFTQMPKTFVSACPPDTFDATCYLNMSIYPDRGHPMNMFGSKLAVALQEILALRQ